MELHRISGCLRNASGMCNENCDHMHFPSDKLISLGQLPEIESEQPTSIPIKVINPTRKRDSKSYMLNLGVKKICHLSCLREEILEQLGKEVVSFNFQTMTTRKFLGRYFHATVTHAPLFYRIIALLSSNTERMFQAAKSITTKRHIQQAPQPYCC